MSDDTTEREAPGDDVPEPPEGYHNQPQVSIEVDDDNDVEDYG
jgi:hypothetical protein